MKCMSVQTEMEVHKSGQFSYNIDVPYSLSMEELFMLKQRFYRLIFPNGNICNSLAAFLTLGLPEALPHK